MYRFLIIDDEPIVREGIAGNIDWAAHGFQLVGTCRDGREGLRAVEELRPDVVLTDICMPFVDGLELAAFVAEQYPATRTVLLTGYDEFEYAQEAVKLRVQDFLLKPITAQELRAHLDAIRAELDTERARQRQHHRIREQVRESMPVLRERFLNRLVRSALESEEITRRFELLEIGLPGPWYVAFVCDPDSVAAEQELTEIAVQNLVADVSAEIGGTVSFTTPREDVVVIVSGSDAEHASTLALDCAESISESTIQQLGVTVSIGMGEPVPTTARIADSYRGARSALAMRMTLGSNHIITVEQMRGAPAATSPTTERELRARFVLSLRTGAPEEARAALERLVDSYQDEGRRATDCYIGMHRLLADSLNALDEMGVDYPGAIGSDQNPFEQLVRLKTLDDMKSWFGEFLESVTGHLESRRNHHSSQKALAAQEHIRHHYADASLSLSDVCRELSVSKSYFSPLFKAHTGMTFVEYLTATRIERARELLATADLRNYEISERVGFGDPHYFSLTFKKQTGLTPTEYRDQAQRARGGTRP